MGDIAIKIENLSKQYRLGDIGTGTLSHDLNRWWHTVRGKEDPTLQIGVENKLAEAGGEYVTVLNNINLEVKKGDIVGVIGKNGAGKSTLLKILSRVTTPTTGTVDMYGRVASLLEVGTGFHPELTGRENIFLNGAIMGMTKHEIKSKFDEIVEFSGVGKYIDTPVKRYSSGMYVRLAFAVSAHLEPEILIVDEVLAVGDAEFQRKAIGKMQDVSKNDGRTVLFVSHNMAAVKSLCKTGIVLVKGNVGFKGKAIDAIEYYLNDDTLNAGITRDEFNPERKGTGDIIIESIEVFQNNNKVDTILSGENVQIRFNYINKNVNNVTSLRIDSIFHNSSGLLIFHVNNKITGNVFTSISKRGYFELFIKKFPLKSGLYFLSYSLINEMNNTYMDAVERAIKIEVIDGDFYKTGRVMSKSLAVFNIDGSWSNK